MSSDVIFSVLCTPNDAFHEIYYYIFSMELTYQNGVVIFEEKRIRITIKYKEKFENNIESLSLSEKTLGESERENYFFFVSHYKR